MIPDDPYRHIEDEALRADHSTPGWKTAAIGEPAQEAMKRIPRAREMTTTIRIDPWRAIVAHLRNQGYTMGEWVRHAIIEKYLREGGDPRTARDAHVTTKVHH